jgi:chromosome segregation ATPase
MHTCPHCGSPFTEGETGAPCPGCGQAADPRATIAALGERLAATEAEIGHMRGQHREDMAQLREQSARHRALAEREQLSRESLQTRLAALATERESLLKTLQTERGEHQKARDEMHAMRRTLSDQREEIAVLRDAVQRTQRRLRERDGDVGAEAQPPAGPAGYQGRCASLEETITTLQATLQETVETLARAREETATARGESEALRARATMEEERFGEAERARAEAEDRISSLEERLGQVETEKAAQDGVAAMLRNELQKTERAHRNALAWSSAMEEQTRSLECLLLAAESREREMRAKLDHLESAQEAADQHPPDTDDAPVRSAIRELDAFHAELSAHIGFLIEVLGESTAPLERMEQACSEVSGELGSMAAENARLADECAELRHRMHEHEAELARMTALERESTEFRTRASNLEDQLDHITQNHEALKLRLQDALADRDRLEQEKSELAITLRQARDRAGAAVSRAEASTRALENARKDAMTGMFGGRGTDRAPFEKEAPPPLAMPVNPDAKPPPPEDEEDPLDDLFRSMGFGNPKKD